MQDDHERRNLLSICRAVMPGVAGVVLSTLSGGVIAHEPRIADPASLATEATATRRADTSTLVARDGQLFLVVFVPQPLAEQWGSSAAPALAA